MARRCPWWQRGRRAETGPATTESILQHRACRYRTLRPSAAAPRHCVLQRALLHGPRRVAPTQHGGTRRASPRGSSALRSPSQWARPLSCLRAEHIGLRCRNLLQSAQLVSGKGTQAVRLPGRTRGSEGPQWTQPKYRCPILPKETPKEFHEDGAAGTFRDAPFTTGKTRDRLKTCQMPTRGCREVVT